MTGARIMTGDLDTLVKLNKQFADEEQREDAAQHFFEQHLSDQLVFRRANGQIVGKDEFLKGLKKNPFERRVAKDISVSLRDSRALVMLVIDATRKDDKSDHRYRNIRLFSRASNEWVVELWYNYEITGI